MGIPLRYPKEGEDEMWLLYLFRCSPFLAMVAGAVLILIGFVYTVWPQSGSKRFAGEPFAEGWGSGWGLYRIRMRSFMFYAVLGFFTPLLFMDAAVYDLSKFDKDGFMEEGRNDADRIFLPMTSAEICAPGTNSVPIALSNGAVNSTDITYWSCECECISNSNCDKFLFEPQPGHNVTYDPLTHDEDQIFGSGVGFCQLWESTNISDTSGESLCNPRSSSLNRDDQDRNEARVWFYKDSASMEKNQCYKGSVLKNFGKTFSQQDVFLKKVCSELAYSNSECYGRVVKGALIEIDRDSEDLDRVFETHNLNVFSRQARYKLDCNHIGNTTVIRDELKVVDCYRRMRVNFGTYINNLGIASAIAYAAMNFNELDGLFGIGTPEPAQLKQWRRIAVAYTITILLSCLWIYLFLDVQGVDFKLWYDGQKSYVSTGTFEGAGLGKGDTRLENPVQTRLGTMYTCYAIALLFIVSLYATYLQAFRGQLLDPWSTFFVELKWFCCRRPTYGTDRWSIVVRLFRQYASMHQDHKITRKSLIEKENTFKKQPPTSKSQGERDAKKEEESNLSLNLDTIVHEMKHRDFVDDAYDKISLECNFGQDADGHRAHETCCTNADESLGSCASLRASWASCCCCGSVCQSQLKPGHFTGEAITLIHTSPDTVKPRNKVKEFTSTERATLFLNEFEEFEALTPEKVKDLANEEGTHDCWKVRYSKVVTVAKSVAKGNTVKEFTSIQKATKFFNTIINKNGDEEMTDKKVKELIEKETVHKDWYFNSKTRARPGDVDIVIDVGCCSTKSFDVPGYWTTESTSLLVQHVLDYPDIKFFDLERTYSIRTLSGIELWDKFYDIMKDIERNEKLGDERDPDYEKKSCCHSCKSKNPIKELMKELNITPKTINWKDLDDSNKKAAKALLEFHHDSVRKDVNWQILSFIAAVRNVPTQVRTDASDDTYLDKGWDKKMHFALNFKDVWLATWPIVSLNLSGQETPSMLYYIGLPLVILFWCFYTLPLNILRLCWGKTLNLTKEEHYHMLIQSFNDAKNVKPFGWWEVGTFDEDEMLNRFGKKIFHKIDEDGDGKIDEGELLKHRLGEKGWEGLVNYKYIDDRDGVLDKKEIIFVNLDEELNHAGVSDGTLAYGIGNFKAGIDETQFNKHIRLAGVHKGGSSATGEVDPEQAAIMEGNGDAFPASMDTNGDGIVDDNELLGAAASTFDPDGDGVGNHDDDDLSSSESDDLAC